MRWFYDLKIAAKLLLAFCLMLSLSALLGVVAVVQMGNINRTSTELSQHWMPSVEMALTLRSQLGEFRRWELAHMLTSDAGRMAKYEQSMAELRTAMASGGERYEKLLELPAQQALYAETLSHWRAFLAEDAKLMAASRLQDKLGAAEIARGESARLYDKLTQGLNSLVRYSVEGGVQASGHADAVFQAARSWIIGLLLAIMLLGLLLAVWVARIVSLPLQQAVQFARQVASGDLTTQVEVCCKDETGQLMQALKHMNDSLRDIVCRVRTGTDTIAAASVQIASGNQDLSSRTEQQASSLEETASTMEELTGTVRQNAANAGQAATLAQAAAEIAVTGGAMVERVIVTMGSINEASKKIADIIGVIDSIAFQTNILALNAAVESARAGEQGRGFAVVASEVRNLAQRSAGAAKDIKTLIGASVSQVDDGAKLADQTGTTMREIVASIGRVTRIVADIAHASAEQSHGIEQVNLAVEQMDQVTQQNAALVEEAAAAAEAMQQQAANLVRAVESFKTGHDQPSGAIRSGARQPTAQDYARLR